MERRKMEVLSWANSGTMSSPEQRVSYGHRGARAAAVGGTAHAALGMAWARKPGYQVRNVSSHSPFNTRVRLCCSRGAPRLLQCICCFFTMRWLTTWFTVDSAKPVLMRSPWRYRSPSLAFPVHRRNNRTCYILSPMHRESLLPMRAQSEVIKLFSSHPSLFSLNISRVLLLFSLHSSR